VIEIEATGVEEPLVSRLRGMEGVTSVVVEEQDETQLVLVQSSLGAQLVQPLIGALEGVTVRAVTAREPTLEDAYVALVGAA